MANQEHLDILKQGIETWNHWRQEHPKIQPDLSGVFFYQANLSEINLSETILCFTYLGRANLKHTNLSRANLSGATLYDTDLSRANLSEASLFGTDLTRANLSQTRLNGADLGKANFSNATFLQTDLTGGHLWHTIFGGVDLRQVQGLDTLSHRGPSHISVDTIYRSEGHIPETFLRNAGVPDSFITYMHSLVVRPIDYYTCFISYSNKDEAFARRLYDDLQSNGVRCWFAPEDMKIGDNIYARIDESIHMYDKLLLVLSEHALASTWVEREVAAALEKEQQQGQRVLFPIRLDGTVMQTKAAWVADIRRRKHIGDFIKWKQHDDYQQALERLLRDLKAGSSSEMP